MVTNPVAAASKADIEYGIRAKAAFNSLQTRPIELLMENGEMTIDEIHEQLTEDEEVSTAQRPHVRKYFEVMQDYGFVDYTEHGGVFKAWNNTVQKNGATPGQIQAFVEEYTDNQ